MVVFSGTVKINVVKINVVEPQGHTGAASSSSDRHAWPTLHPCIHRIAVTDRELGRDDACGLGNLVVLRLDREFAVAESASKVTVAGGAPFSIAPVSVTPTFTVSASAREPVRVSVKTAAVPSVTEFDCAVTLRVSVFVVSFAAEIDTSRVCPAATAAVGSLTSRSPQCLRRP